MAGFGKLFSTFFDSSIMDEDLETRYLFMSMLALATAKGEVDISIGSLARRVGLQAAAVRQAIDRLEAPDPESRSVAEDGRRLMRLDSHRSWGWLIVNYAAFRKARGEDERREYQASWIRDKREKERSDSGDQDLSTTVDHSRPQSTNAEAEAEADKRERAPSTHPDYSEEYAAVLEVYLECKLRWYLILKRPRPKKPTLNEPTKTAIRNAIKAGHAVDSICEAIRHVENDAWLMGMTERCQAPQLTLTTILLVRTNGGKPLDRVQQLIDKTVPDPAMRAPIGLLDNRSDFVHEEDLPPLAIVPDEGSLF